MSNQVLLNFKNFGVSGGVKVQTALWLNFMVIHPRIVKTFRRHLDENSPKSAGFIIWGLYIYVPSFIAIDQIY